MTPIVCVDCQCNDEQADAAAALITAGLSVMAACRVTWGA